MILVFGLLLRLVTRMAVHDTLARLILKTACVEYKYVCSTIYVVQNFGRFGGFI